MSFFGRYNFKFETLNIILRAVFGFQTNNSGPHKAFEYSVPLRAGADLEWLRIKSGLVHLDYGDIGSNIEVDVISLKKKTMTRFSVSPLFLFI